ncbi:SDR family NAD(P)-dependent oxidoreductase [Candidatus Planktophila dulcis]|uniref:SDR family NAD(P)-dependent oxidoreductase n=1 Tax=Candidatus Planktophila dulcis TaxID=1884914 RepID=UPI003BEEECBF
MREKSFASKGDAVIVTGAAGGIGAATVENLVNQGIFVFAVDKNSEALAKILTAIDPTSSLTQAIVADITIEKECQAISDTVKNKGIRVKGLVNNAAVGAFNMSVENTSFEDWQRIISINLTSLYLMAKYSLPLIRSAGGGAVVNVSSIHAYATSTGVAPYAAAKGGVLTLTKTMALDLAPDNIRVVCIIPGATDTPMLRQHAEREGKTLAELGFPTSENAIGRIAQPEEVADVIAFALSRGASFITGSSLIPDGGILAKF